MTDTLTKEETDYYAGRLGTAIEIVRQCFSYGDAPDWESIAPFVPCVFEKIASPLYFLRERGPAMTDVTPAPSETVHGGEPTVWREATKPNAHGMTHYAREDYVKADALPVLQYLRVHPNVQDERSGYVYELSNYNNKDYLWRKAVPKEGPP